MKYVYHDSQKTWYIWTPINNLFPKGVLMNTYFQYTYSSFGDYALFSFKKS